MLGRTPGNIVAIRPLRQGVISDYTVTEKMIKYFVQKAMGRRTFKKPVISICVPSGITEVERKAVEEATYAAGAREVNLIEEPVAAAIGAGIDISKACGSLLVDIGGGTTEIAVISLGGIVCKESIRVAGDVFTAEIQQYMRQQHNIRIGEITAELIKINAGSALTDLEDGPEPYLVKGPNLMTAHPVEVSVTPQEIAHCLDKSLAKIEAAVMSVLEQTPPELYSDIVDRGIFLSGGGALIRGLDKRLQDKINIPFHVAEDPLRAVARGTSIALKKADKLTFLMR
jgi:rod shape-determining protein MreB